jgi:hypothetical protein
MPLCTIHLLSLKPRTTLPEFLTSLSTAEIQPLITSKVLRWIILPTSLSTSILLAQNIHWDLLLILPTTESLPSGPLSLTDHRWSVITGVPSKLLQNFKIKNEKLLHPLRAGELPLTGSLDTPKIADSAQDLELSVELQNWISEFSQTLPGKGPVSMLNLLSFVPGKKDEYLKYGAEFARSAGSRRGGLAKIVGSVVHDKNSKTHDEEGWDEVALAHYPSIVHFADMIASEDYQAINHKYRVGSLKDTFILCTSELAIEEELRKWEGPKL